MRTKIIHFSPWYVNLVEDVIISDKERWDSILELHKDMMLTADVRVRVFGEMCKLISPKRFMNSIHSLIFHCKCPTGIRNSSVVQCKVCNTWPQPFNNMAQLRRKFANLVDRTRLIDWYVFTQSLEDLAQTIYTPLVVGATCTECRAEVDMGHMPTCSRALRKNLFIVMVVPNNTIACLSKYEPMVLALKEFNILFMTQVEFREMEVKHYDR